MATTGTSLYIDAMTMLPDGRMLLENSGQQRFRVKKVVQEKPYMMCEVEWLAEDAVASIDDQDKLRELAAKVLDLFKNVLELNFKLRGVSKEDINLTIDFTEKGRMTPAQISFWVASMFSGEGEGRPGRWMGQDGRRDGDAVRCGREASRGAETDAVFSRAHSWIVRGSQTRKSANSSCWRWTTPSPGYSMRRRSSRRRSNTSLPRPRSRAFLRIARRRRTRWQAPRGIGGVEGDMVGVGARAARGTEPVSLCL